MSWSFKLCTVRGIPIRVHASFLLILVWAAWVGLSDSGGRPIGAGQYRRSWSCSPCCSSSASCSTSSATASWRSSSASRSTTSPSGPSAASPGSAACPAPHARVPDHRGRARCQRHPGARCSAASRLVVDRSGPAARPCSRPAAAERAFSIRRTGQSWCLLAGAAERACWHLQPDPRVPDGRRAPAALAPGRLPAVPDRHAGWPRSSGRGWPSCCVGVVVHPAGQFLPRAGRRRSSFSAPGRSAAR